MNENGHEHWNNSENSEYKWRKNNNAAANQQNTATWSVHHAALI